MGFTDGLKAIGKAIGGIGAALAIIISIISLITSIDASNKANANQVEENRLASAYKVAWYIHQQPGGSLQLRIENHGLLPAYNVLMLDERDDQFYRTWTVMPCQRYQVDFPEDFNPQNFSLRFQSAGQWYETIRNRKVEAIKDAKGADKNFGTYSTRKDATETRSLQQNYDDLNGCG